MVFHAFKSGLPLYKSLLSLKSQTEPKYNQLNRYLLACGHDEEQRNGGGWSEFGREPTVPSYKYYGLSLTTSWSEIVSNGEERNFIGWFHPLFLSLWKCYIL